VYLSNRSSGKFPLSESIGTLKICGVPPEGIDSSDAIIANEEVVVEDIFVAVSALTEGFAKRLPAALVKASERESDELAKLSQLVGEFFPDQNIDPDEGKPLFIVLDALRRTQPLYFPDPTFVSTTHLQESDSPSMSGKNQRSALGLRVPVV
jgi:hypothetical protein